MIVDAHRQSRIRTARDQKERLQDGGLSHVVRTQQEIERPGAIELDIRQSLEMTDSGMIQTLYIDIEKGLVSPS